jgi:hypothetical protein
LLTLWNHGGLSPSISLKGCKFMNKIRDNIEIIFLVTIFISSLSAITPIT